MEGKMEVEMEGKMEVEMEGKMEVEMEGKMEESCTKDAVRNQLNKFIIHDHILLSLATMTKCYDYHVSLMYTSQFIDSFIVSLIMSCATIC